MRITFLKLSAPACLTFALVLLSLPFTLRADTTIPTSFRFEQTLKQRARGEDVRYLQVLLNRDQETRVNAPGLLGGAGSETDFFGGATNRAVIKFQDKYATAILKPADLKKGNGTVGSLTRMKLNALLLTAEREALKMADQTVAIAPPIISEALSLTATTTSQFSFEEINVKTREALVNILCTTKRGGSFDPLSGSGVIVDPRGIILTNAHVGQFFLLKDYLSQGFIDCTIRTGAPARNKYRATLLYISPVWIVENAKKISEDEATGTGENDFALLLIQEPTQKDIPLPPVFPFIPMDTRDDSFQTPRYVLGAGYPAGLLSGITIQRDLYPTSSEVKTGRVYGFTTADIPDIFSIGGSVLAQHGSSGGAVVSTEGKLVGLIVTSSMGKTTDERNLNAITMSHLRASYQKDTGESLASLFAGDPTASVQKFNEIVAPGLKQKLIDALTKE